MGHPAEIYEELLGRVQAEGLTQFAAIEHTWLRLMWAMDAFRTAGLAPSGMGNPKIEAGRRFAAVYRTKGMWFPRIVAALLQQRTRQEIAAKNEVRGFSQPHQVDVAWPARDVDPLVCIETKVTGAPGFGSTPARSALADWTNRRKEIKFAATDLKLFRRQQETHIEHWGVWRASAPPKTYFLWAARLRAEGRTDSMDTLLKEAQVLIHTYVEGAGLLAWRTKPGGGGYEIVRVPEESRVTSLDDVLYRVASEINALAPRGTPPPPHVPVAEVEGARDVVREDDQPQP